MLPQRDAAIVTHYASQDEEPELDPLGPNAKLESIGPDANSQPSEGRPVDGSDGRRGKGSSSTLP